MFATLRFLLTAKQLKDRAALSHDQMLAVQLEAFRALVQFAVQRSPFYRRKYQGIDVTRCQPADLPTLNKREMMSGFDEVVTDPAIKLDAVGRFLENPDNLGRYFLGKYVVCHTSGSQGQPAVVVMDRPSVAMPFATQIVRGNGGPKSWFEAFKNAVRRSRLAVVTLRRGFYPSGAAFEYLPSGMRTLVNVLRLSQNDGTDPVVRRLNEFRPNYLTAYASVLEMLAREEQAGRLKLCQTGCLKQITNMSEPMPVTSRHVIQEVFGVRVVDNYSMAECMALSNGCTRFDGAHINMDLALAENVDEHNGPVPPGTPGSKVLVTNLYNRVQPLIRYEIGDVITLSRDPCPCGSNLALVSSIQGRTKDKFWIRQGEGYREVLPYVFMAPLLYCLDVAEYQIVQTKRNEFCVYVAPLPGVQVDLARVERHVMAGLQKESLDTGLSVQFIVVDSIHPDPRSGKVKRMLSLVGPPPELAGAEDAATAVAA